MKGTKTHRDRKSPGSKEFFQKQRRERNEARPKQVYDTVMKTWSRN